MDEQVVDAPAIRGRRPVDRVVRTVKGLPTTELVGGRPADGQGRGSPGPQVRPQAVRHVRPLPSDVEGDARRSIALRLVWIYAALLFASVLVPVAMYFLAPAPSDSTLSAIKDLGGPITVGVSSVTGVIGFVLGYYFKSEERKSS
jgi:hypothetical protein